MAHKRRKHKISGTKRRRTHHRSGIGAIDTQNILGVVAGSVLAGYLNKIVPATFNDKILAAGKVAIGIALPMVSKNGKTKNLLAGVGAGFIAVGSVDLLKSFGALSGDFDIPVINGEVLSGDDDIPVINGEVLSGDDDIPVINGEVLSGDDDMMSGDDEMSGDDYMMSGDDE